MSGVNAVSRRGFTLVELLTVTGVLAILFVLLLPVVQSMRSEGAKGMRCPSNLKQLATAAAMYVSDYDNRYPPAGLTCLDPSQPDGSPGCEAGALVRDRDGREDPARIGYGETWQGGGFTPLYPYTKNWVILWCPKMGSISPAATDPKSYYSGFEWLKSPERVRYPANKTMLIEAYSFHEAEKEAVRRLDDPPNPRRRHYIAFVDGHVKAMDLSNGCSDNPHPSCVGWESCMGPGGNGNYVCSGFGKGVDAPDFPPVWVEAPMDVGGRPAR